MKSIGKMNLPTFTSTSSIIPLLSIFGAPHKQKNIKYKKKRKRENIKKLKEMLEEIKNTYQLRRTYQNAQEIAKRLLLGKEMGLGLIIKL